jgi:hypothetical protein
LCVVELSELCSFVSRHAPWADTGAKGRSERTDWLQKEKFESTTRTLINKGKKVQKDKKAKPAQLNQGMY